MLANQMITQRTRLLDAQAVRDAIAKGGELGINFFQNLISSIRRLVLAIAKIFNCQCKVGATEPGANTPSNEALPLPATSQLMTGISPLVERGAATGSLINEDFGTLLANDGAGISIEMDLTGSIEAIAAARVAVMEHLQLMTVGDGDFLSGLADPDQASAMVRRLANDAERLLYAQRLSARQCILIANEMIASNPSYSGKSAVEVITSLRRDNTSPQTSSDNVYAMQLLAVMEVESTIAEKVKSQVTAAIGLVMAHPTAADQILKEFNNASKQAELALSTSEKSLLSEIKSKGPMGLDLDAISAQANQQFTVQKASDLIASLMASGQVASSVSENNKTLGVAPRDDSTITTAPSNSEPPKPPAAEPPRKSGFGSSGSISAEQMRADAEADAAEDAELSDDTNSN